MSYDTWKATNPADEFLGSAEQRLPAVPVNGGNYRGFTIKPHRHMSGMWEAVHPDYAGADDATDPRYFVGDSVQECADQVNEYWEECEEAASGG